MTKREARSNFNVEEELPQCFRLSFDEACPARSCVISIADPESKESYILDLGVSTGSGKSSLQLYSKMGIGPENTVRLEDLLKDLKKALLSKNLTQREWIQAANSLISASASDQNSIYSCITREITRINNSIPFDDSNSGLEDLLYPGNKGFFYSLEDSMEASRKLASGPEKKVCLNCLTWERKVEELKAELRDLKQSQMKKIKEDETVANYDNALKTARMKLDKMSRELDTVRDQLVKYEVPLKKPSISSKKLISLLRDTFEPENDLNWISKETHCFKTLKKNHDLKVEKYQNGRKRWFFISSYLAGVKNGKQNQYTYMSLDLEKPISEQDTQSRWIFITFSPVDCIFIEEEFNTKALSKYAVIALWDKTVRVTYLDSPEFFKLRYYCMVDYRFDSRSRNQCYGKILHTCKRGFVYYITENREKIVKVEVNGFKEQDINTTLLPLETNSLITMMNISDSDQMYIGLEDGKIMVVDLMEKTIKVDLLTDPQCYLTTMASLGPLLLVVKYVSPASGSLLYLFSDNVEVVKQEVTLENHFSSSAFVSVPLGKEIHRVIVLAEHEGSSTLQFYVFKEAEKRLVMFFEENYWWSDRIINGLTLVDNYIYIFGKYNRHATYKKSFKNTIGRIKIHLQN